MLRFALLIIAHLVALVACRIHVFLRGVPVPKEMAPTKDQLKLIGQRIWMLKPFVPVPQFHSLPRRTARALAGFFRTLKDTPAMFKRKAEDNDNDFAPSIRTHMQGYPDYYCKNFHHQTEGYFSRESARRYDLQYELVFYGLGQEVRETSASQLRRFLPATYRGRMLELGSGTAQLGIALKMLFPESSVLITDPSVPYLEHALEKYPCLEALLEPTFAENLSAFADSSFGVVFSGFIYHEMPAEVVQVSFREAFRVLEPGGYLLIADSAQDTDGPENHFALDQFQQAFHEPFYDEFRAGDLQSDAQKAGFVIRHSQLVFFTKCIIAQKPREPLS